MRIYTFKKQKIKKKIKNFLRCDSTKRLKIWRFRRKDYRKKLTKMGHVKLHTGRI